MLTRGASLATSGLFVLVVFRLTKNNKEPRAWRVPYRGQVLDRKPISKLKNPACRDRNVRVSQSKSPRVNTLNCVFNQTRMLIGDRRCAHNINNPNML